MSSAEDLRPEDGAAARAEGVRDEGTRTLPKWVERFARASGSVKPTSDAREFLTDLADAALQVSRSRNAYAILMEGDEVRAEAGLTASGDECAPGDVVRKLGARAAIRAAKEAAGQGTPCPVLPIQETPDGHHALPFLVRDDLAGCVVLAGAAADADGARDVALTSALVMAQAQVFEARSARDAASDRADSEERRRADIERSVASGGVGAVAYLKTVAELERDAIELALRNTRWNKEEAARRLGISRASIYMKVKKYGLQKPPAAGGANTH